VQRIDGRTKDDSVSACYVRYYVMLGYRCLSYHVVTQAGMAACIAAREVSEA